MDLLISVVTATIIFILIFTSKKVSIKAKVVWLIAYMIFVLYVANERQFCLSNLSFNYNKKLESTFSGLIDKQIEFDKKKREAFYKSKGYSQKQIEEIILSLENRYQNERKKIFTYCKVDDICFLDYLNGFDYKYGNCITEHHWTHDDNTDWINIEYKFDKESYDFFNEIVEFHSQNSIFVKVYVSNHNKNAKWYKELVYGMKANQMFLNGCEIGFVDGFFKRDFIPIYTDLNSSITKKYILDTKE